ncbi:MAG: hypothetical protein CL910_18015 [Deltaproteobacteria bacterium]|nr:hypothetical protein [Deltaproteobacteria bacterium]
MTGNVVHRYRLLVAAVVLVLCAASPAQLAFDIPVPAGMPAVLGGPAFSDEGALAVCGGGRIDVWTGLLDAPVHEFVVPTGPQAMIGRWYRLADHRAVYRARGIDGTPGTLDDPLMLVTNLPAAPLLVDTGLRGVSADWIPVNEAAAVRVQGSTFQVLRHANGTASIETVPSPSPAIVGPQYGFGTLDRRSFAVLGTGGDAQAGTNDDLVLVLSGLDGSTSTVSTIALPAGSAPAGFLVTESGVAVMWRAMTLPTVRFTFGRDLPTNPAFTSLDVTPPASPSPGTSPSFGARRVPGDAIVAYCQDDLGPGEGRTLVNDVSTTAVAVGGWYDDWNGGCTSSVVSGTEHVRYCATGGLSFNYANLEAGVSHTVNQPFDGNVLVEDMPGRSLVTFSTAPSWITGSGPVATTTVFPDAHTPALAQTFTTAGRWAGDGYDASGAYWSPRIVRINEGLVAGFVSSTGGSQIDVLRLISVPSMSILGSGSSAGEAHLELTSGMPGASSSVVALELSTPVGWDTAAWVFIGLGSAQVPIPLPTPAFAAGSFLYLDPGAIALSIPVSLDPNGVGGVAFDISGIESLIAGQVFDVQGLVADANGVAHVSEALELVLS